MERIKISEIAGECAMAHTEFIEKLDLIAKKYNIPRKVIYETAIEIMQRVDIDDN